MLLRLLLPAISLLLFSNSLVYCSFSTWKDYPEDPVRLKMPKPLSWAEKPLGQWCRNFSHNIHNQCPHASFVHQFDCCGESGTECCFAIQGWVYVVGGCVAVGIVITIAFNALLSANLIFKREELVKNDYIAHL